MVHLWGWDQIEITSEIALPLFNRVSDFVLETVQNFSSHNSSSFTLIESSLCYLIALLSSLSSRFIDFASPPGPPYFLFSSLVELVDSQLQTLMLMYLPHPEELFTRLSIKDSISNVYKVWNIYRTRAIITRSWFETSLDYKPRILGPHFLV